MLAGASQEAATIVVDANEQAALLMGSAEGARDQQVEAARAESDKLRAQAQDDAAALRAESLELHDTAATAKADLLESAKVEADAAIAARPRDGRPPRRGGPRRRAAAPRHRVDRGRVAARQRVHRVRPDA